ncbi:MAG TPA: lipoyl synthase [Acidimicrobiaceae bacterium]|nr:lipoyl synthase [Acidimicrobiaceae bacterium]
MLRVRWLGRVRYAEALDLQRRLFESAGDDYLLLLEHHPVFTAGANADLSNLLRDPGEAGADFARVERGGDLTYHGPGQLTGYPILTLPGRRGGGLAETAAYVRRLEQVLIDTLADVGLPGCGRLERYPGVWADPEGAPRKIAAIGVRLRRGRTMHGFALNVSTDLDWYRLIVPCGITEFPVTSLAAEGVDASMRDVVDAVAARSAAELERAGAAGAGAPEHERMDVAWRHRPEDLSVFSRTGEPGQAGEPGRAGAGAPEPRSRARLAAAGVGEGLEIRRRKPAWLKARVDVNPGYRRLRSVMARHDLVTVCEEAGCPNIFECWGAGTATFMINGADCTRACGFCLVGTAKPQPLDPGEPARVAAAVREMELAHVVVTAVARDDLADGGAAAFAETVRAIRSSAGEPPAVEVLVPDFGGDAAALATVVEARPDVANHNIETVPRLQRAVRPSAGYARSLTVLARLRAAGLTTKSGVIVGMGETDAEVDATLADLAAVGVRIVTIGQYLRPTSHHVPVDRWVEPAAFERWRAVGEALGIAHVESSPLTRSSYRADVGAAAVAAGAGGPGNKVSATADRPARADRAAPATVPA